MARALQAVSKPCLKAPYGGSSRMTMVKLISSSYQILIISPQLTPGCITNSKSVTLFWDQRKYTKTVYHDPQWNIAMTRTLAGSKSFRAYMAKHKDPCENIHVFETHIILEAASITEENDNSSFQSYDHNPQESEQMGNNFCLHP